MEQNMRSKCAGMGKYAAGIPYAQKRFMHSTISTMSYVWRLLGVGQNWPKVAYILGVA